MSFPGLTYDAADMPTQSQIEHKIHRIDGEFYRWCEICRCEEICIGCDGQGVRDGNDCVACEGSGRKI